MRPATPCTILEAIGIMEGFYADTPAGSPNRPQRNNNPGDLEYHPWQSEYGAVKGTDPRFAQFPSVNAGWGCLHRLLTFPAYRGKTIAQFINEFAPGNENNTAQYIKNVCAFTELTPDTVIDNYIAKTKADVA